VERPAVLATARTISRARVAAAGLRARLPAGPGCAGPRPVRSFRTYSRDR